MTLVPVLALVVTELVLQLAGYGYPTSYFLKTRIHGRTAFVENGRFGVRFFPPGLARIPAPTVLGVDKPAGTYRIFVLGESAALGDPEPAFGFGRYLEVLLRERFPETRFEVICTAMTAVNSHAITPIARECAKHDGDLWVVYMGHNEVVGPFGAGTILGSRTPNLLLLRASLALKRTHVGQLLDAATDRLVRAPASPGSWQGMKMFAGAETRHDDSGRIRTTEYFARNLQEILFTAENAGVKVVLSTVASNLKDCAPFASLHSSGLTAAQLSSWEQSYREGIRLENTGELKAAASKYLEAVAVDGEFAELHFRLGRCYLGLTNHAQARRSFELARDFDALHFRADSGLNTMIREAAARFTSKGVSVVDAVEVLMQASPQGITGNELFYEHVHLNFEGNYLLARAIAEQIAGQLPASVTGRDKREWISAEACGRSLCITLWDRYRAYGNIRQREAEAPFTLQLNHADHLKTITERLAEIRSLMSLEARDQASEMYRQALLKRPNDFLLHGNFAKFLEETGDYSRAVTEWKRVGELLPYHFGPCFYLGKLFARMGRHAEAEQSLTKTLQLRPDVVEAMDELGQVLAKQRKTQAAFDYFDQALRLQPGNARLHLHIAEALASQNKRDEAISSLRRAVELRADYWEARYLLGVELAIRGEVQEALEHFSEVIRLNPDYALAHLNLGVALTRQNRFNEAIARFREALRLDPSNKLAREYLLKLQASPAGNPTLP
jgi:tetratricopeptide (TPR) repeat protein